MWTIDDCDEPAMVNKPDIYRMDAGFISRRRARKMQKCPSMSNFWDKWATRYRNWRVIFAAVGFLSILAWGSYELLTTPGLVDSCAESAVVLEVKKYNLSLGASAEGTGSRDAIYRGRLLLSDSTTVELMLVPPIPKVGDRLPIKIESYDDGSLYYSIDIVKWQTEGSR